MNKQHITNDPRPAHESERGSALIVVLGVLVLISVLTASLVVVSQSSARSSRTAYDYSLSAYATEGATERVLWLLMKDKKQSGNRALGEISIVDNDDPEAVRFMADGTTQVVDYYNSKIEVTLYDMNSGIDISGTANKMSDKFKHIKQQYFDEPELLEQFKEFEDKLLDYIDGDDLIRLNGAEKVDYSSAGSAPLPRNSRLQFRQEMSYIPGVENYFNVDDLGRFSEFRIITSSSALSKKNKPNFFATDIQTITDTCLMTETETQMVIDAKISWELERISLTESLDPLLYNRLKSKFSFTESGFYTLIVKGQQGEGGIPRTLATSLKVGKTMPTRGNKFYEWLLY